MHEGSPNKKSDGQKVPERQDVKRTLREIADMTPTEREEKRKAYLGSQLSHGKLNMTPQELEAHRQVLERKKRIEGRP